MVSKATQQRLKEVFKERRNKKPFDASLSTTKPRIQHERRKSSQGFKDEKEKVVEKTN